MKPILASVWKKLGLPKNLQLSIMRVFHAQFLIGVTGVILNEKNEVLLVQHTYRKPDWSLPGGYINGGEHPKEALEREIEEETGLIISADVHMKTRTDRETARLDISYRGTFIGGDFRPSHEVKNAAFFSFENLPLITRSQVLLIDSAIKSKKNRQQTVKDIPEYKTSSFVSRVLNRLHFSNK